MTIQLVLVESVCVCAIETAPQSTTHPGPFPRGPGALSLTVTMLIKPYNSVGSGSSSEELHCAPGRESSGSVACTRLDWA